MKSTERVRIVPRFHVHNRSEPKPTRLKINSRIGHPKVCTTYWVGILARVCLIHLNESLSGRCDAGGRRPKCHNAKHTRSWLKLSARLCTWIQSEGDERRSMTSRSLKSKMKSLQQRAILPARLSKLGCRSYFSLSTATQPRTFASPSYSITKVSVAA